METLTRHVKVKLLVHDSKGMARIDGSKSSHQASNPSHLVSRIICKFLNYIAFCYQSYRWLIDSRF